MLAWSMPGFSGLSAPEDYSNLLSPLRLLKLLCIVWGTRLLPLTTEICTFNVYFKLTFFKQNCNFTIEKENV